MPKLRVLKSRRIKDIPTQNPYNYAGQVMPIYEIHRVLRSEMVELSCRSTHCIKARSTKVHENDNLYELFRKFTNKDVKFMRQWLKLFSISNQQNLEVRARRYLASKGLAFDNWMTSITDGMKGDILVLYTLCMLFDKHVIVHLRHGLVWSTLEDLSQDHYADLKKCELHLCYVGRGLFVELMERETPLEIVKDTEAVQSLIIGELSTTEEQTIQLIETAGLGVGVSKEHDTHTTISSTSSKIASLPSTSKPATSVPTTDRYVKLELVKLNIKPGDRITVSDNLLASIPVSKYVASKTVSSENTVQYWPLDKNEQRRLLQTTTPSVSKNVQQRTFTMSTHGIRQRKHRYYFKCKIGPCNKSYSNIRDWNAHHRQKHGTLIRCTSCPKSFTMPSAHHAHVYTHSPARHKCTQCTCKFAFVSWLKQHKYAHMKTNLHKCFHGKCKRSYRWPQDLSRHITKHLDKLWSCNECDKTFKEKRLLKRHSIKHTDVYRYKCNRCHYRTKWPTPYRRHVLKCK